MRFRWLGSCLRVTNWLRMSASAGKKQTTLLRYGFKKPDKQRTQPAQDYHVEGDKASEPMDYCMDDPTERETPSGKMNDAKEGGSSVAAYDAHSHSNVEGGGWSESQLDDGTAALGIGDSDAIDEDIDAPYVLSQGAGAGVKHTLPQFTADTTFPPVERSRAHAVLFDTADIRGFPTDPPPRPPRPSPPTFADKWDADFVRMPCSGNNTIALEDDDSLSRSTHKIKRRWDVIWSELSARFSTTYDLEIAILRYNPTHAKQWNFGALHYFVNFMCEDAERQMYMEEVLPAIVQLALRLPEICTAPIPLLRRETAGAVTMTQLQAACIVANAFLCTFPRRNSHNRRSEFASYPPINFIGMFSSESARLPRTLHGDEVHCSTKTAGKFRCIFNYFRRVTASPPVGTITFYRRWARKGENWSASREPLTDLEVRSVGTIEDDGDGLLQADFANKFLGGGALSKGCVQEEIRFMICPELIAGMLICEELGPLECIVVVGAERYSNYAGYASTFEFAGSHADITDRDVFGRRMTSIVAIDALVFREHASQFGKQQVDRELNKARVGFTRDDPDGTPEGVATGNWGCGAFGGDRQLKAIIQLLAASVARRPMLYFTFGDEGASIARLTFTAVWDVPDPARIAGCSSTLTTACEMKSGHDAIAKCIRSE